VRTARREPPAAQRNAMLLFSREMHKKFAGTPLADHFLADES
jgi:ABC-type uncharacterized transport system permease subunit